jgi:proline iminopeptidase
MKPTSGAKKLPLVARFLNTPQLGPLYFYDFAPYKDTLSDAFKDMICSAGAWNHSYMNCWSQYNVIPHLPAVTVPTLIVSGAHDWITPTKEGGQRIHDALPNSEYVVFEKSGHYPYIEENTRFFQILREWLAKQVG